MEENSKDQGDLFRVVMKLQKAENKLSFYGIVMQYLKSQKFYLVAVLYSIYVYINSASLPFMIRCMITSGNGDDTC